MKIFKTLIGITLLAIAAGAFAHTGLESSNPAADAMLMESPRAVELNFTEEVNLTKFEVVNKMGGAAVEVEFTPSLTANSHFSLPVPEMAMGHYQVNWVLLGKDGHKVEGNFDFMVHSGGTMPMTQMGQGQMMDHSTMPMGEGQMEQGQMMNGATTPMGSGQMMNHSMMSESPAEAVGSEGSSEHDH
jgi:copper resistance protein C